MKLTGVEIKDFKSISDSTPFEVGQITCLVGKNESGKTALLQASTSGTPSSRNTRSST